jgi:hypothetical protein
MAINVDGLMFDFPPGWDVGKYDEWRFYRRQFQRVRNHMKAVDLLAVDPRSTLWLIEAKDYRKGPSKEKPSELPHTIAGKVVDTLAALLPARVNGTVDEEVSLASKALEAQQIRVVLHMEQPAKHSKLFPRVFDPANTQQMLRRLLKAVDAHPIVVDQDNMRGLEWMVSDA